MYYADVTVMSQKFVIHVYICTGNLEHLLNLQTKDRPQKNICHAHHGLFFILTNHIYKYMCNNVSSIAMSVLPQFTALLYLIVINTLALLHAHTVSPLSLTVILASNSLSWLFNIFNIHFTT